MIINPTETTYYILKNPNNTYINGSVEPGNNVSKGVNSSIILITTDLAVYEAKCNELDLLISE